MLLCCCHVTFMFTFKETVVESNKTVTLNEVVVVVLAKLGKLNSFVYSYTYVLSLIAVML